MPSLCHREVIKVKTRKKKQKYQIFPISWLSLGVFSSNIPFIFCEFELMIKLILHTLIYHYFNIFIYNLNTPLRFLLSFWWDDVDAFSDARPSFHDWVLWPQDTLSAWLHWLVSMFQFSLTEHILISLIPFWLQCRYLKRKKLCSEHYGGHAIINAILNTGCKI